MKCLVCSKSLAVGKFTTVYAKAVPLKRACAFITGDLVKNADSDSVEVSGA